jgi:hypothetical protein
MLHSFTSLRLYVAKGGALLAVLALAMQLAASGLALPHLMQAELGSTICAAEASGAPTQPAEDHSDCALCPLCAVAAFSPALLAPSQLILRASRLDVAAGMGGVPIGLPHRLLNGAAIARGPPAAV